MSKDIDGVCPHCGHPVDDATGLGKAFADRPEPGDLALCIACTEPAFYVDNGETLGLRLPTDAEKVVLSGNRKVQEARETIRKVMAL